MHPIYLGIISSFAWAFGAWFITNGLRRISSHQRIGGVALGLCSSIFTGLALLILYEGSLPIGFSTSPGVTYQLAAGLLLFPVATGSYYLSASAFNNKAQFAAQFAKVKPVLTIGLATIFLGESLEAMAWVAVSFVTAGILIMLTEKNGSTSSKLAVFWGLLMALSWALGDVFVKLGDLSGTSLQTTIRVMSFGAFITLALTVFARLASSISFPKPGTWLLFFVGHGVLSFGIGYPFLFASIRHLGVSQTALITAFWPLLSILISFSIDHFRGVSSSPVPKKIILASILLLLGSLIQIYSLL